MGIFSGRLEGRALRLAAALALATCASCASSSSALASQVSCGQVITTDTKLDNDLVGCPVDGIVIGADGIALDLAGHTISGSGFGFGVGVDGFRDVTVRDGTIRDFELGVAGQNAGGMTVSGITVDQAQNSSFVPFPFFGISAQSSPGSRIDGNIVYWYGIAGISVGSGTEVSGNTVVGGPLPPLSCLSVGGAVPADDTHVSRNSVSGCSRGIEAATVGSVIERNRLSGNYEGLVVDGGHDNLVEDNTVVTNTHIGIQIFDSSANVVTRNEVHGNPDIGIGLHLLSFGAASSDNLIDHNDVSGSWEGIVTGPSAGANQFTRNHAHDNGYAGLAIGMAGSLVDHNHADHNGHWGIGADAGVTVAQNFADFNGAWGIWGPVATDGGGNHATGNGEGQCFGIVCR